MDNWNDNCEARSEAKSPRPLRGLQVDFSLPHFLPDLWLGVSIPYIYRERERKRRREEGRMGEGERESECVHWIGMCEWSQRLTNAAAQQPWVKKEGAMKIYVQRLQPKEISYTIIYFLKRIPLFCYTLFNYNNLQTYWPCREFSFSTSSSKLSWTHFSNILLFAVLIYIYD